jgi:glycerophosphoryl diester phosphodiesterase
VTQVIGHRGAPQVEPENTLPSFEAAARLGADGVELDVRRTAGRYLAVHHDAHLADGRPLMATAGADLPPEVPDLGAVLDVTAGLDVVNVEIKSWPDDIDFDPTLGFVDRVVDELLARPAGERARLLVSCFHLPSLDRVRERAPGLATAWLVLGPGADGRTPPDVDPVAEMVAQVADRGHVALHPHHFFVSAELVAAAHARDVAVNTWTCDDPDRIRWLADLGVDAVVTNVPDVALTALGRAAVPGRPPAA